MMQQALSITRDAVGLGPPAPVPQVKFCFSKNLGLPDVFCTSRVSSFEARSARDGRGHPNTVWFASTHRSDLMILFLLIWGHLLDRRRPRLSLPSWRTSSFSGSVGVVLGMNLSSCSRRACAMP